MQTCILLRAVPASKGARTDIKPQDGTVPSMTRTPAADVGASRRPAGRAGAHRVASLRGRLSVGAVQRPVVDLNCRVAGVHRPKPDTFAAIGPRVG